jgi:transcriptional regulator with XRE-family HTH domain
LYNEIGVATGTMSSWITYDRIPKADVAVKIAKALGVSVEYLVVGDNQDQELEKEIVKEKVYVLWISIEFSSLQQNKSFH